MKTFLTGELRSIVRGVFLGVVLLVVLFAVVGCASTPPPCMSSDTQCRLDALEKQAEFETFCRRNPWAAQCEFG